MRKVFASRTYIKYKDHKNGDVLVDGSYLKSEMSELYQKLNHIFKTPTGEVVLNSTGKLDFLVRDYLTSGMRCKIIYLGKIVLTKGPRKGKESHDFELYTDESKEAVTASDDVEEVVRADTSSLPEMSI